jgi:predicted enzyme related to lactoylglutathione lyase
MTSNPVRWFEIYVQDMNRAKKFYESVFQTTLTKMDSTSKDMDYCMFPPLVQDKGGTSGALVKMTGVPSGGMGTLIYFGCEDCAVEAARVKQFGGRIKDEKKSIGPYGFIALAYDTEGNLIGLHSLK